MIVLYVYEDDVSITIASAESHKEQLDKNLYSGVPKLLFAMVGEDYNHCMSLIHEKLEWEPYVPY